MIHAVTDQADYGDAYYADRTPRHTLVIVVRSQMCIRCGRWLSIGTEATRLHRDRLAHAACADDGGVLSPGGR